MGLTTSVSECYNCLKKVLKNEVCQLRTFDYDNGSNLYFVLEIFIKLPSLGAHVCVHAITRNSIPARHYICFDELYSYTVLNQNKIKEK